MVRCSMVRLCATGCARPAAGGEGGVPPPEKEAPTPVVLGSPTPKNVLVFKVWDLTQRVVWHSL